MLRLYSLPVDPNAANAVGYREQQSSVYVAVKTVFAVPTTLTSCSLAYELGYWIGLGGSDTTGPYRGRDLVQQGVECGNTDVGSGYSHRPFSQLANTFGALPFCGYNSWTIPTGHVVYQNMSFQTSSNTACFYLEDETTGVIHSCHAVPGSPWHWDLNTAEWVAEAPTGGALNFGSIRFTDANAELGSTSTWVTLGSQAPITELADGYTSSTYCIAPGAIGSDRASFTDSWIRTDCGFP